MVDAKIIAQAANVNSRTIPLDWRQCGFEVSFVLTSSGTTTGATVEVTLDDIQDPSVTPVWVAAPISGVTWPITAAAAAFRLHDGPWRACRLATNNTGSDTTSLHILQN